MKKSGTQIKPFLCGSLNCSTTTVPTGASGASKETKICKITLKIKNTVF